MLQRIQSIYLIIVVLVGGALPFVLSLWKDAEGNAVYAVSELWVILLLIASAIVALVSVFAFKNRKNQFVLNRLNMILNLILLGVFAYRSLNLSGESNISEKGVGMFLPVVSIVFLVLANKAIKKDEDLVKSVDRLR
ncbi:DUF4293 domain-containing protein [Sinomicrobium weinanense]|uniref:DUF4293 domain-containing protein n=1 Tax=Sinomicrobium weinanense TaxID=2842200 RepID=A0A926Q555_9FLAO|nr:DUF4293 domain-containing protein [Sinomicrobium weinanense]MBC9797605.1 DUF4293 domain-containing protein [Sinomicrobium weinanense]MBU3123427.1 DUF4293 domain-containing protein [Sinomicrobium weinanense]